MVKPKQQSGVEVSQHDLDFLMMCSLRYCMGRMSTAPSEFQDIAKKLVVSMSAQSRAIMLRDVTEELHKKEAFGHKLGAACDHKSWQEFQLWLEAWVRCDKST